MKILVISDEESKILTDYYKENGFDDISFILSAGDLPYTYLQTVKSNLNKPIFYVRGNHDTYIPKFFDKNFIEWKLAETCGVRILGIGCRKRSGQILTENEMKRKLKRLHRKVRNKEHIDIIIAHYPALGIGNGQDKTHIGYSAIKDFIEKIKPTYFVYGHNHLNYSNGKRTIKNNDIVHLNAFEKFVIEI